MKLLQSGVRIFRQKFLLTGMTRLMYLFNILWYLVYGLKKDPHPSPLPQAGEGAATPRTARLRRRFG